MMSFAGMFERRIPAVRWHHDPERTSQHEQHGQVLVH